MKVTKTAGYVIITYKDKVYAQKSINIEAAKTNTIWRLKNGVHMHDELQAIVKKDGIGVLDFYLVRELPKDTTVINIGKPW